MFYMFADTAVANASVVNANFDSFDLVAGQSYDFGVYFGSAVPTGGSANDYCSQVVQVFSA